MSNPESERVCRTCVLKEAWRNYCVAEDDWIDPEGSCAWWTAIPPEKPKIEFWDEVPPEVA